MSETKLSEHDYLMLLECATGLLYSDLYEAKLRRILLKDPDPKILADFLAMDDMVSVAWILMGASTLVTGRGEREKVFDGIYRKLKQRVLPADPITEGGMKLFFLLRDSYNRPFGPYESVLKMTLERAETYRI